MNFEFDPAKSRTNKEKHGIDFVAAQELWRDENRLMLTVTGTVEARWLLVARMGGKTWTTVFTRRAENIRLISVRRRETMRKKRMKKNKKKITAAEFDRRFDAGEDIPEFIDWKSATRPGHAKKRVNVDFPQWMLNKLDLAASRHGSTRQAIIKHWLADRLKAEAA